MDVFFFGRQTFTLKSLRVGEAGSWKDAQQGEARQEECVPLSERTPGTQWIDF